MRKAKAPSKLLSNMIWRAIPPFNNPKRSKWTDYNTFLEAYYPRFIGFDVDDTTLSMQAEKVDTFDCAFPATSREFWILRDAALNQ